MGVWLWRKDGFECENDKLTILCKNIGVGHSLGITILNHNQSMNEKRILKLFRDYFVNLNGKREIIANRNEWIGFLSSIDFSLTKPWFVLMSQELTTDIITVEKNEGGIPGALFIVWKTAIHFELRFYLFPSPRKTLKSSVTSIRSCPILSRFFWTNYTSRFIPSLFLSFSLFPRKYKFIETSLNESLEAVLTKIPENDKSKQAIELLKAKKV